MKKMPTLFKLEYIKEDGKQTRIMHRDVTPGCEWVLAGEGIPYIKIDGTCCLVKDGKIYRRYDAKNGKTPPIGAIPCQAEPDPITGHFPHWLLCEEKNKQDQYHLAAFNNLENKADGTYELIGKHFQTNPYDLETDYLVKHDDKVLIIPEDESCLDPNSAIGVLTDRSYEGIRNYLEHNYIEGIVFHRANGDMCKIKRSDFGFHWKVDKCKCREKEVL